MILRQMLTCYIANHLSRLLLVDLPPPRLLLPLRPRRQQAMVLPLPHMEQLLKRRQATVHLLPRLPLTMELRPQITEVPLLITHKAHQ